MTVAAQPRLAGSRAWRLAGVFVGLAGLCAAITILWWSMRAVMEIGGSCASGNTPYEIARPCPRGIPALMLGSIFGGIAMLFVYAVSAAGRESLWPLAWPALFLSLGWNFLEYGLDPPGAAGVAPGWLVCAVVFGLMGAVPLWILLRAGWFGTTLRGNRAFLAIQAVAIAFGIWAGWRIFDWGNG